MTSDNDRGSTRTGRKHSDASTPSYGSSSDYNRGRLAEMGQEVSPSGYEDDLYTKRSGDGTPLVESGIYRQGAQAERSARDEAAPDAATGYPQGPGGYGTTTAYGSNYPGERPGDFGAREATNADLDGEAEWDRKEAVSRASALHDPDYARWRSEQMSQLDSDYAAWREERPGKFPDEFVQWRAEREPLGSQSNTPAPPNATPNASGGIGGSSGLPSAGHTENRGKNVS